MRIMRFTIKLKKKGPVASSKKIWTPWTIWDYNINISQKKLEQMSDALGFFKNCLRPFLQLKSSERFYLTLYY